MQWHPIKETTDSSSKTKGEKINLDFSHGKRPKCNPLALKRYHFKYIEQLPFKPQAASVDIY